VILIKNKKNQLFTVTTVIGVWCRIIEMLFIIITVKDHLFVHSFVLQTSNKVRCVYLVHSYIESKQIKFGALNGSSPFIRVASDSVIEQRSIVNHSISNTPFNHHCCFFFVVFPGPVCPRLRVI
jgi:hypothetical protein